MRFSITILTVSSILGVTSALFIPSVTKGACPGVKSGSLPLPPPGPPLLPPGFSDIMAPNAMEDAEGSKKMLARSPNSDSKDGAQNHGTKDKPVNAVDALGEREQEIEKNLDKLFC
jgi:hypothetical protein